LKASVAASFNGDSDGDAVSHFVPLGVPRPHSAGQHVFDALEMLVDAENIDGLATFPGNIHAVGLCEFTVLQYAASRRSVVVTDWAIRNGVGRCGVDKKTRTAGMTALMVACADGVNTLVPAPSLATADDPACAKLLVESGANPLEQAYDGKTALHFAVIARHVAIVRYLVSLVQDFPAILSLEATPPSFQNSEGLVDVLPPASPLSLALKLGFDDIVAILRAAQVRVTHCALPSFC
jgi:ankyrin repeat protein